MMESHYDAAMKATTMTAAAFELDRLVLAARRADPSKGYDEHREIQLSNIAYFAGYYGDETRQRVENLYGCEHPVFGEFAAFGSPPPEVSFRMGQAIGAMMSRGVPFERAIRDIAPPMAEHRRLKMDIEAGRDVEAAARRLREIESMSWDALVPPRGA